MAIAATKHCDFEGRTAAVDTRVAALFPALPDAALLAVGGYGRREMFPCSDVDLLILTSEDAPTAGGFSYFLQSLWDAGLRVSQSIHSAKECLTLDEHNFELTMSLLDQRFLAGSEALYNQLSGPLEAFLRRREEEILRRLTRLTRERHQRFQGTIYHLEPNLKDGPGGLRDYQVVRWFARLNSDLETPAEISSAAGTLNEFRWQLHELSGRDHNVLDFESQERIADDEDRAPEAVMSDFYRHARQIQRACLVRLEAEEAQDSTLFSGFRDRWSRVSNADFTVTRGLIYLRAPNPDIPRLFEFVARHGLRLAPDAGRRIQAQPVPPGSLNWKQLQTILTLPHAALALREMYETGVLTAIFPELAAIECLVIRDFYHQYTVDEHTLVAIANVLELRNQTDSHFAELAREHSDLSLLLMALLFHDTGKGGEHESHAEASARLAEGALRRIGMPEQDLATVLFLVRAHLDMSAIMNGRDLTDPVTIRGLADRAETVEKLKLLTLLTYADISAVNPAAMSPWRASLLWQLYSATYREFTRELQTDRIHVADEFLEGLPVRYLRTHSQTEIQKHIAMARKGTEVDVQRNGSVYLLTVAAPDRPFFFSSIAGAISSFGMNILKAEAFSNTRGVVIDTFTFADPLRTLELNPSEVQEMEKTVKRTAQGEEDVAQLLKKRPVPRFSSFAPRISFDNSVSEEATLVQIIAQDRPGLLYDVTNVLSSAGCNIDVVLIDTQGRKAIDVFYVTKDAGKLTDEATRDLEARLNALL